MKNKKSRERKKTSDLCVYQEVNFFFFTSIFNDRFLSEIIISSLPSELTWQISLIDEKSKGETK